MKITVISDTHFLDYQNLPIRIIDDIADSDIVIHAGDMLSSSFHNELESKCKKLYAVKGNNDNFYLPMDIVLPLGRETICITHSDGIIGDRINNLLYKFSSHSPTIIIFGHTHRPYMEKINNTILLNPGSVYNNRYETFNSYATINISNEKTDVLIITLEKK